MSKLPNDPLLNISLQQLIQKIKSQTISCEEVTKIYLKRIELLNEKLHSYIYIDYEGAIQSASAIDNLISSGVDLGPLMGTPIAIKDICAVSGLSLIHI